MIVLFTDFGLAGPYTGQVKAVLHDEAPGVPVIDLFADAPQVRRLSPRRLRRMVPTGNGIPQDDPLALPS